jgi:DNA-damage-inducible protein J
MDATVLHIKTDVKTRDEAKKVAEDFGFSLTSLVNAMLKEIVRKKRLTLSMDETPSQFFIDAMEEAEEDVKAGRVKSFTSVKDAKAYLADLIDNDDNTQTTNH